MTSMPVIAIVGRPNVGKSSLLNALVGKRIAIVQDVPGVTRDRVATHLVLDGRYVELVDTGGYGFVDPDQLTEHIRQQIELAMGRADLVLFVVDCQTGLTTADQEVAGILRRRGLKTVLVGNKADGARADAMLGDFGRLGLGTPLLVSAMNGRNLEELVATIRRNVDLSSAPTEIPEPEMMIAIVGKRNAGKSTLVNTIAGIYEGDSNRVIVSEVPGTTRDSIDVRVERDGNALVVIDTAGVRKKRHMVTNDIEYYSFHRAQRSVRRADVVLLLIDSTEPVSEPDKKLAQYIAEQFKPVVLVINKWDLAREALREQAKAQGHPADERVLMSKYREYLNAELRHLDFAPVAFISAKAGENVEAVISASRRLYNQGRQRITTSKLNQAIRQILQERLPSTHSGRRAKVYFVTQIQLAPPSIALVVNEPFLFDDTYLRFILNRLRQLLPYPEIPVRLLVRPRGPGGQGKPLEDQSVEEIEELSEELPVPREPRTAAKPRPKPAAPRNDSPVPRRAARPKKVSRPEPKPRPKGAPRQGGGRAGKRSR